MADIFLSFSVADTDRAQPIYDAFLARGLTVFWCHAIPKSAPNYQATIEEELLKATVVIVLWTHMSVQSGPVIQECSQAQRYKKLMQVVLDDDILPIKFPMEILFKAQKTMLAGWIGDVRHPEWRMLNESIDERIRYSASPEYRRSAGHLYQVLDRLRDIKMKKPPRHSAKGHDAAVRTESKPMPSDPEYMYRCAMSVIAKIAEGAKLLDHVSVQGVFGSKEQVRVVLSEAAASHDQFRGDHWDIVERAFARFGDKPPSHRVDECCSGLLAHMTSPSPR